MTTTVADLHAPLTRYAGVLHEGVGARHHVASPLGAWLLLALAAPAATGVDRDTLAGVLGVDLQTAAASAGELLGRPHPLVRSGAAVWLRQGPRTPSIDAWLAGLPSPVTTGDMPAQAEADAWADEHTDGLIDRFPLTVRPETALLLATALATQVSWDTPFDVVPATGLGPHSAWGERLAGVLRTPSGHGHEQFVAATDGAGDVAVHAARARGGLTVVSVAAAPEAPAPDVLAAAYDLAVATATRAPVRRRSLFDLPLTDGPLWTLSERPAVTTAAGGREERCTAIMPAWSARSDHDLGRAELGFPVAAGALAEALGLTTYDYEARQSAVARYHRVGFEAAAVSAMAVLASMPMPRDGLIREAELRFGHPYAVVAVATEERHGSGGTVRGPWHGLPVFSAWVATPENATDS